MKTLYVYQSEKRYRIKCDPEKRTLSVQRESYDEQKPGRVAEFDWWKWQTILRGKHWDLSDASKLIDMYELGGALFK